MADNDVLIRPLASADLDEADRVYRLAFGTFLGVPEPARFAGDSDAVRTRWRAHPAGALAACLDGRLVGSNFATSWGSVGFFGPLTVAPEHWNRAIGQRLLDATMELFAAWGTRHTGLFTFSHSARHVRLYQKYGFWPRFLTAIMSAPVEAGAAPGAAVLVSELPGPELPGVMRSVAGLTGAVYPGLDISGEIGAVAAQQLGDTVLIEDGTDLQAVAVCHIGPGTEAGSGTCYIKFAAVRPGPGAPRQFGLLLDACHRLAARRGASVLVAGANAGCDQAWAALASRGFRPVMQGVAMHRPNDPGYHTSGSYVIGDWR